MFVLRISINLANTSGSHDKFVKDVNIAYNWHLIKPTLINISIAQALLSLLNIKISQTKQVTK